MFTLTFTPAPDTTGIRATLAGGHAEVLRTRARSVDPDAGRVGMRRFQIVVIRPSDDRMFTLDAYADELTVTLIPAAPRPVHPRRQARRAAFGSRRRGVPTPARPTLAVVR